MRFTGLWRNRDFMRLWVGQIISKFGSQIGDGALQFTAILALGATPVQLGLLAAARTAPVLLFGLLAGVWVDRLRRRPILIAADLGRGLLLCSIPAAALLGTLRIEQLYVVAALTSLLSLCFDVAYQSYLPALVRRDQLVEGNSKLGISDSVAEIAGPPLGGGLVQLISAPLAVLVDAGSFLASALALALIRTPEPAPPSPQHQQVWHEIAEGLRVALGTPVLRALLCSGVTISLAGGAIGSLYNLYAIQELGLSPAAIGLVIGVGGISALVGALVAERAARRFGVGVALVGGLALGGGAQMLILLARGPVSVNLALLLLAQAADIGLAVYFINEVSLRQAITPDRLLGRVNASAGFLMAGAGLVGALAGGALGQFAGLRAAMAVGLVGMLLSSLWLVFSPVRNLREPPVPPDSPAV
jgi:MFS family permease